MDTISQFFNQTINRSVENIARFDFDTHLIPPLTKYNAVMEFVLTKAGEDIIISTNFVFPTKIKDAVGIRDPKIKVSTAFMKLPLLYYETNFCLHCQ